MKFFKLLLTACVMLVNLQASASILDYFNIFAWFRAKQESRPAANSQQPNNVIAAPKNPQTEEEQLAAQREIHRRLKAQPEARKKKEQEEKQAKLEAEKKEEAERVKAQREIYLQSKAQQAQRNKKEEEDRLRKLAEDAQQEKEEEEQKKANIAAWIETKKKRTKEQEQKSAQERAAREEQSRKNQEENKKKEEARAKEMQPMIDAGKAEQAKQSAKSALVKLDEVKQTIKSFKKEFKVLNNALKTALDQKNEAQKRAKVALSAQEGKGPDIIMAYIADENKAYQDEHAAERAEYRAQNDLEELEKKYNTFITESEAWWNKLKPEMPIILTNLDSYREQIVKLTEEQENELGLENSPFTKSWHKPLVWEELHNISQENNSFHDILRKCNRL